MPGWDDNEATFEMMIVANNLHGDFQLANGYGHNDAKKVLQVTPYLLHTYLFLFLKIFSTSIPGGKAPSILIYLGILINLGNLQRCQDPKGRD